MSRVKKLTTAQAAPQVDLGKLTKQELVAVYGSAVFQSPWRHFAALCRGGDPVKTEAFKAEFRAARAAWDEHVRRVGPTVAGLPPWERSRERRVRSLTWADLIPEVIPTGPRAARREMNRAAAAFQAAADAEWFKRAGYVSGVKGVDR